MQAASQCSVSRTSARKRDRRLVLLCMLIVAPPFFSPPALAAQQTQRVDVAAEAFVDSEWEDYLRLLQVQGTSEVYPWSIRSYSPQEIDRLLPTDTLHPWAGRYDLRPDSVGGIRWAWVRPRVDAIYNSAFPYGVNDGAIWAGRGLTTAVQAGFAARYGPVSLTVAPIAFRAENAGFPLRSTGLSGMGEFANPGAPTAIDAPQRFGDEPYWRLDPGQSTLRLDLPIIAAGVSTANQQWGPAMEYPLLLGPNAPGFPHLFLGTSAPLNLWIGRVHGRLVWGRLDQSDYSPVQGVETRRFMSGVVGVFTPRGVPGLEIGGGRFFHTPWPEGGLEAKDFLKPLEGFLKAGLQEADSTVADAKSDVDNQLASAFFRWLLPKSGFEVYGEYGREDHNWDLRDFLLEPDHDSAYLLGFRKGWDLSSRHLISLRAEVVNAQRSHLDRVRYQSPFYIHGWTRQGHTQRGQILGSPAAYGGAGSILAADLYHTSGRWSLSWARTLQGELEDGFSSAGVENRRALDVLHTINAEVLWFRGRFDVTTGLRGGYNLNRNFGSDAFNLNAVLGVRASLW